MSPFGDWLDDQIAQIRRRTPETLSAAQQAAILQIIFANTKIGVALYDRDYVLVTCNHNYQRLMNLPEALCMPGARLHDVIAANARHGCYGAVDGDTFPDQRMAFIRQGQPIEIEVPVGERFVLVTGLHLREGGVVYTYQDVTQVRQAERSLQALLSQSAAQHAQTARKNLEFQTLIDNIPQGVSLWDRDFRMVTCNDAYLRFVGLPDALKESRPHLEETLRRCVDNGEFGALDTHALVTERVRAIVQGHTDRFLTRYRRTNPRGVTLEITETPLPNGGFVATHSDISTSIENERLLRLVADRQDATNRQSRKAIVDEINASIAHEINQPLSVIGIHAYLLQELLERPVIDRRKVAESLAAITGSIGRAQNVQHKIKALLGGATATPIAADLNAIVEKALEFVSPHMTIGKIAVRRRYAADLPKILIDAVAFQQVIVNLMLNARDAIDEAKPPARAIDVATAFDPQTGKARVIVADSGPGIGPESLADIFQPFFTTKVKGLGMGLAICKTIVESLGGAISAASPPGGGARFTIELDCGPASHAEA